MKVLVGIDGTERSYHALDFATQFLSPETDGVCLYFSPPRFKLQTKADVAADLSEMARNALAESVMDQAKKRLGASFLQNVDAVVGDNDPHHGILAAAEQAHADLIVIGAHSATRRMQIFLGGTARKVAHASNVPVLLVRERQEKSTGGMKVLVACDDTDRWRDTANVLANFSWPAGTKGFLYRVIETMDDEQMSLVARHAHPAIANAEALIAEYRNNVAVQKSAEQKKLESGRESHPSIIKDATAMIGVGHPVEAIVHEARESDIDLVVVGARRLGRFGRLFGSTTEGLLAQCPCSLLVVHDREKP